MPHLPLLRQVGVAASALGLLGAAALGYVLRRPLPQVDGGLRVPGITAPVEIVRDRWGIPHVLATSVEDALFGEGFCHAQDRLWQMDLNRRLARGELSEAVGADALDVDRFMRRLGIHRAAADEWQRLDPEWRALLSAYASGVNAWIREVQSSGRLPVEYLLARFQPRLWEPTDSLAFGRYFAFTQSPNWESELMRARLIAHLGERGVAAVEPDVLSPVAGLLPSLEDWGPSEMPEGKDISSLDLSGGPVGSNAWVVSGSRSSTGKPLLANDPHLSPGYPSIFYEVHLVGGDDLEVVGASAPGVPGVLIGHNRDIAWGFTASMADVQDLFVERQDPSNPLRFQFNGNWESGRVVREVIQVKGRAKPHLEDVVLTPRHGPLLTPTPAIANEYRPLALRSAVLEAPETFPALINLCRASDWATFRSALAEWATPSLNALYADVKGNIGYQMVGRIPIRARGQGLVPSPGWQGRYEWIGEIPFDELPNAFNPSDGLWANANHDAAKGNRHFVSREFIGPHRYRRIRQALEARERHSVADFAVLQSDETSLPGQEIARLLSENVAPSGALDTRALALLRAWDGRVGAASVGAAVYEAFRMAYLRERHGGVLGDLLPAVLGVGPHPLLAPISSYYHRQTDRVLLGVQQWASNPRADDTVQRAFRQATRDLQGRLRAGPEGWQWGALHALRLRHALSARPPLGWVFDVPSFPWSGDLETVRAGGSVPGRFEAGGLISGYRFIADCSDWDTSLSCIPGGQSGHRGSAQYADQVGAWRQVSHHPLAFSRSAISRVQRHSLTLTPANA